MPSFWSSVPYSEWNTRRSNITPSDSPPSNERFTASLAAITASPGNAWTAAQALYAGLPDLSLGRFFEASLGMFRATYDWAFGAPAGPVEPGGEALPKPSGWSPQGWLNGG